jgi:hypothetical protein
MNNTNQTHSQTIQQNVQTKLNRFNTLLTKALQQHNQALFSLSVGALLELQDLLFSTSKTTPTKPSNQTSEQNTTKEEKKSLIKDSFCKPFFLKSFLSANF